MVKRKSIPRRGVAGIASFIGGKLLSKMAKKRTRRVTGTTSTNKRMKMSKSKSYTKIDKKKESAEADAQHNDLSNSHLSISIRKPKRFEKSNGTWTYYHQYTGLFGTSTSGLQMVADGVCLCSIEQLLGAKVANGVAQTSNQTWANNPFDMNPFQTNTGGNVFGSVLSPVPDYVHISTVDWEVNLTNFSTVAVEIDFNILICKKTCDNSPTQAWGLALQNKALGQAIESPPTALAGTAIVYGYPYVANNAVNYAQSKVSNANATYGLSPYSEKEFNQVWKKLGRRVYTLPGGATKKVIMKIGYHKTISKGYLTSIQTSTALPSFIAGLSVVPLIIARAAPVLDTALSCVTHGIVDLGMTSNQKVNFMAPAAKATRLEVNRVAPNFVSESTVSAGVYTNLKIINDIDTLAQQIVG